MKAATVLHGDIEVRDIPAPPDLGPGQIRVRIEACGICGSDLSLRKDVDQFVRVSRLGRHASSDFDADDYVVPGHEFAGVVDAVAPDVTSFSEGDRVTGLGIVTDQVTGERSIIGYSNSYPGGFGELVVINAESARMIPDGMSFDTASLAEPLHVGETHVQRSGFGTDDRGLVIGAGTIGLGVVIALRERGCDDITVVEPSPRRRQIATALGAHRVVEPPTDGGPVAALDPGSTARVVVYECSGRQGVIEELTRTLPQGSYIQVVASPFTEETFVPVIAQWRQLIINFGGGPVEDSYGITLRRLAEGRIDPDLFITAHVDLHGVAQAFEDLRDPERHVKIVVHPGRT